jgi:hypothetical protein
MSHNHGVGDVSTIQTPPPVEHHFAGHIQKIPKMIADHITLTALALHWHFLLNRLCLSLAKQVLDVFSFSAFTPPAAVSRIILPGNLAVAYLTKLRPCSIALPIDVFASLRM